MPLVRLSSSEASSLRKISSRPCLRAELPSDHSAKFVNYGLASPEGMTLRITPRGQVELLASTFQMPFPTARDVRERLMPAKFSRMRRSLP